MSVIRRHLKNRTSSNAEDVEHSDVQRLFININNLVDLSLTIQLFVQILIPGRFRLRDVSLEGGVELLLSG